VEPADKQSPVYSFAAKGGGLHHVCCVVDNLEKALADARAGSDCHAAAYAGSRVRRQAHRLGLHPKPSADRVSGTLIQWIPRSVRARLRRAGGASWQRALAR
jgi:hypothetical protein